MSPQFAAFLDDSKWTGPTKETVWPLTIAQGINKYADSRDDDNELHVSGAIRRSGGKVNECREDRGKRIAIYALARRLRSKREAVEVDHIIPLSKGGRHTSENLQIIYASENGQKRARLDYKPQVVFA